MDTHSNLLTKLKNPRTNWKYVLIVVILVFLVCGGILGYLWWAKEEAKIPEKVVEDETAGWKTERNEEFGFEVKYPKDWYVYKMGENKVVFSNFSKEQIQEIIERVKVQQKVTELESIAYSLEILIVEKPLDDWLKEQQRWAEMLGIDFFKEKIPIGSYEGYKISGITKGERGYSKVLSNGKNVYLIETLFPERCRFEECEIFNKMLSTFKFLK